MSGGMGMASVTVEQIAEELRQLPAEKLTVAYDFVGYLRQKSSLAAALAPESAWLAEAGMADYLTRRPPHSSGIRPTVVLIHPTRIRKPERQVKNGSDRPV
jgi:hypothetical protein